MPQNFSKSLDRKTQHYILLARPGVQHWTNGVVLLTCILSCYNINFRRARTKTGRARLSARCAARPPRCTSRTLRTPRTLHTPRTRSLVSRRDYENFAIMNERTFFSFRREIVMDTVLVVLVKTPSLMLPCAYP